MFTSNLKLLMETPNLDPARHEEFVALYVRHEPAAFLSSPWCDTLLMRRMVQRASMTMWRCFDNYKAGTNFRNWAFQVAKNGTLNHLRKVRRDRHVFGEKLLVMLAEQVEERSADLETVAEHWISASSSCLVERNMVAGCYAEGSNIRSFAEKAGETANTIYKRLNRVRASYSNASSDLIGLEEEAFG